MPLCPEKLLMFTHISAFFGIIKVSVGQTPKVCTISSLSPLETFDISRVIITKDLNKARNIESWLYPGFVIPGEFIRSLLGRTRGT